ncbi:MAG: hypothetical protein ACI8QZ_002112, partial [Chlamydiales bacterium]
GQASLRSLPKAALAGWNSRPLDASARVAGPAPLHSVVDSLPRSVFEAPASELPKVELELMTRGDSGGNFEGGAASLETRRGGWRAMVTQADDDSIFAAELGVEGSFYSFAGAPPLGGISAAPFNDLYRTQLGFSYAQRPQIGHIGHFEGVEVTFGGEDNVQATDGATGGLLGGLRYRAAENLTLAAGVAALSRLDDDAWIWPFLGFDWQVSDTVNFEILGPDIELGWNASDSLRGFLSAEYDLRQYRLNEDGPTGGAAFRDESIRVGGGLEWRPKRALKLRLEGGVAYWRELTLLPTDGSASSESELDPSPYLGFELVYSF